MNPLTATRKELSAKAKEYGIQGVSKLDVQSLRMKIVGYELAQDPRIQRMLIKSSK